MPVRAALVLMTLVLRPMPVRRTDSAVLRGDSQVLGSLVVRALALVWAAVRASAVGRLVAVGPELDSADSVQVRGHLAVPADSVVRV